MRQPKSVYNARYRATAKGKQAQRRARSKYKKAHPNVQHTESQHTRRAMYKQQRGLCALCQQPIRYRMCVLDHDHKTGQGRALVHALCNMLIGWIESYTELVPATLAYIAKHNAN